MGTTWAYIRVSKDDQENSIDVQTERVTEAAKRLGLEIDPACIMVDEDVSGGKLLRLRKSGRILWDAMDPGDTLIFLRVDRVFRSMRDAAESIHVWAEKGIRVVITDLGIDLATAAGRMMFHQLAAFAEFEREMISQRTREALQKMKAEGKKYGGVRPLGWVWNGQKRLVPFHAERQVGALIVQMRDQGFSLRRTHWELMRAGISRPPVPGKKNRKATSGSPIVWLSLSAIHALSVATRLGFPTVPRSSMRSSCLPPKQTSDSDETQQPDPPASLAG